MRNSFNFGARKLLKGFIEQDLSHLFGVYMEISLGGLNILVAHHFFDLVNGSSHSQKVLGVGMPEPVGRGRKACFFHCLADGANQVPHPKG